VLPDVAPEVPEEPLLPEVLPVWAEADADARPRAVATDAAQASDHQLRFRVGPLLSCAM
jgi:hypothetical protein